jgi:phage terminase large subunit GpA-like protein
LTYPDRDRADRDARAGGKVPVYLVNTNIIKDGIVNDLAREVSGRGYVHFPKWLPESWFAELCSENRTERGWKRTDESEPNEAFVLMAYARAALIRIGAEAVNWAAPPTWASDWDTNPFVFERKDDRPPPVVAPARVAGRRVLSKGI